MESRGTKNLPTDRNRLTTLSLVSLKLPSAFIIIQTGHFLPAAATAVKTRSTDNVIRADILHRVIRNKIYESQIYKKNIRRCLLCLYEQGLDLVAMNIKTVRKYLISYLCVVNMHECSI